MSESTPSEQREHALIELERQLLRWKFDREFNQEPAESFAERIALLFPVSERFTRDDVLIQKIEEQWESTMGASSVMLHDSEWRKVISALKEHDAKAAARWNICLYLNMFPTRLGSPFFKEGGYVKWTIHGKYYGLTENECADDAIRGESERPSE